MIITLPRIFWEDHYERCSDHPGERNILNNKARNIVTVELDDEALANLKSDADLYATPGQFEPEYRSLCRSAERTLVAIKRKQGTRK